MVKGRGKGKKLSVTNNNEDRETEEIEKIPLPKRRGRPEKPLKDETEEIEKVEDDDDSDNAIAIANDMGSKETRISSAEKNDKKRKKTPQSKETVDKEKNGNKLSKADGFRHNGSRRKSKPRRAAEAGVVCR